MMKNESIKIWLEHETMVDISFLYLSVKSKIPLPGKDWEAHRRRWGEWSLGDGVGLGAWPHCASDCASNTRSQGTIESQSCQYCIGHFFWSRDRHPPQVVADPAGFLTGTVKIEASAGQLSTRKSVQPGVWVMWVPPKMGWLFNERPTVNNMSGRVWSPQTSPEKLHSSRLLQDGTTIKKEDLDAKAGGTSQVATGWLKLRLSGETGEEGGGEGWMLSSHQHRGVWKYMEIQLAKY